jgi:hypothetical protein
VCFAGAKHTGSKVERFQGFKVRKPQKPQKPRNLRNQKFDIIVQSQANWERPIGLARSDFNNGGTGMSRSTMKLIETTMREKLFGVRRLDCALVNSSE